MLERGERQRGEVLERRGRDREEECWRGGGGGGGGTEGRAGEKDRQRGGLLERGRDRGEEC